MSQFDESEIDTPEADSTSVDNYGVNYHNRAVSQVQSIDADYFTIVDAEDWPIAGLVVLLDRRRQAVRAELHLYEDGERQNEYALRQSQQILGNQYYSADPVQLQVMQSYPWRETLEIHANAVATPENDIMAFVRQYWQYIAGAAALILLILFIWFIASFFRSPDDTETTAAALPTAAVQAETSSGGVAGG
ncbi:MAG: hypothetical protein R2867_16465 [Caldilineaceae bacterium]